MNTRLIKDPTSMKMSKRTAKKIRRILKCRYPRFPVFLAIEMWADCEIATIKKDQANRRSAKSACPSIQHKAREFGGENSQEAGVTVNESLKDGGLGEVEKIGSQETNPGEGT
jgi:hypothetical protein